jgi:hypothetical protein
MFSSWFAKWLRGVMEFAIPVLVVVQDVAGWITRLWLGRARTPGCKDGHVMYTYVCGLGTTNDIGKGF